VQYESGWNFFGCVVGVVIFLAYLTSARSDAKSIIEVSVFFGFWGSCCSYMCIKNTSFVRE